MQQRQERIAREDEARADARIAKDAADAIAKEAAKKAIHDDMCGVQSLTLHVFLRYSLGAGWLLSSPDLNSGGTASGGRHVQGRHKAAG